MPLIKLIKKNRERTQLNKARNERVAIACYISKTQKIITEYYETVIYQVIRQLIRKA